MEEKEAVYLVVLNRDQILGEFTQYDDAHLFSYISALHADKGDIVEVFQGKDGYEVG